MQPDDVLDFWFPPGFNQDEATLMQQVPRWFRGGADEDIIHRFAALTEAAALGAHDDWALTPRTRLALVLVLDQFSRSLWRDSARAYAQDAKAARLAEAAIDAGDHLSLPPFEGMFLCVALGHSEDMRLHDKSCDAARALAERAPPQLRRLFDVCVSQAEAHRDVIRRFGRHPHRNHALGRQSTPEEETYLKSETPPHMRKVQ